MKDSLRAGLEVRHVIEVDRRRTIDFMGEDLRVYATPEIVRDIELTCRDMVLEHLDDGEDTVGTRVEVDHLGATLLGGSVAVSVTVTGVDGRLISFEASVMEGDAQVARGLHTRFVIDKGKFAQRLAQKAGS